MLGKNRRQSSIFDSCWGNEVSNFRLRKFWEVEPFCEPNEADVDVNNINSLDNSGSNEIMQKVLALMVWLQRSFQKKFGGPKVRKLELLCLTDSTDLPKPTNDESFQLFIRFGLGTYIGLKTK